MPLHSQNASFREQRNVSVSIFLIWAAAVGALGFVLGYSGGPAVRRTLAIDGAMLGAGFAVVHLAVREIVRRGRDRAV